MFDYLKRILTQEPGKENEINIEPAINTVEENNENKLQVATAALYVEIAAADGDFSEEERKKIVNAMKENFNLSDQCVEDLITNARLFLYVHPESFEWLDFLKQLLLIH